MTKPGEIDMRLNYGPVLAACVVLVLFGATRPAAVSEPSGLGKQSGGVSGLTAEYFENSDFTNHKITRIEPQLDSTVAPPAEINTTDGYSVIWSGVYTPTVSGPHGFTPYSDYNSIITVYVNGQFAQSLGWTIINGSPVWFRTTNGTVLTAGQPYKLVVKVQFFGPNPGTHVSLGLDGTIIPQSQLQPAVVANVPTNTRAYATGSGKISLYWNAAGGSGGYNVYEAMTSLQENFLNPPNGGSPTNALSYPGGNTFTFSDTGRTNGSQHFYVIKATYPNPVTGLVTESSPSNEDTEVVDPTGIPWDSRSASAINSAFAAKCSEPVDGNLQAMGPDGTVYSAQSGGIGIGGGGSAGSEGHGPFTKPGAQGSGPLPVAIINQERNALDFSDGNSMPYITEPVPPSIGPNVNSGPYRRLVSQPNFTKAQVGLTLPAGVLQTPFVYPVPKPTRHRTDPVTGITTLVPIPNTVDNPFIYIGSVGSHGEAVDAGLAYNSSVGKFQAFLAAPFDPNKQYVYVDTVDAAANPTLPTYLMGERVQISYMISTNPATVSLKGYVYLRVASRDGFSDPIWLGCQVAGHPTSGAGVKMKRVCATAQFLASGPPYNDFERGYKLSGSSWGPAQFDIAKLGAGGGANWIAANTTSNVLFPNSGVVQVQTISPFWFENVTIHL